MKKALLLALCIFNFQALALGGFDSLSSSEQQFINSVMDELGLKDSDSSAKMKVYDSISYVFEGSWDSYWLGLNELSASKYKDGLEKGLIEMSINNSNHGTIFLTFVYKPETKQIIIFNKQIRHGSKKTLLNEFEKRKADDKYKKQHEKDNYALLQEQGQVDFEYFHVTGDTGSLVYSSQLYIDL
ncbi:hypothetical protein [Pseudoalteromonas sp. GB56]